MGFRPFVYNLAKELSVRGFITNTSEGVSLTIEGENIGVFIERLRKDAPPLAKIQSIDILPCANAGFDDFSIRESRDSGSFTLVSPDVSVCADCCCELFDRVDRRFLYPFINCTNCGPRYSITRSVPYDRENTTMAVFTMCPQCEAEYRDPRDRRFHAQPNACGRCGPRMMLSVGKNEIQAAAPVSRAVTMLKEGMILAVKGLGGFHLVCDATNGGAVQRLRDRKRKNNKPFGLMAPDVAAARKFCHVTADEEALLLSGQRPIVLLKRLAQDSLEAVAPGNRCLGFMLPYVPLHYLLFYHPDETGRSTQMPHFDALVMTSGNISEEPIVIHNSDAEQRLAGMADAFLYHNRDIFMRVDDSVVRHAAASALSPSKTFFIRRSRGYVPDPVLLPGDGPDVLGCGADLKNTFTLTRGRYAIPSQHIGDMENIETLDFFEETLRNLKAVYRAEPVALAHDLHPGYLSTRWALAQEGIEKFGIQHHYAHIASVMAEKGLSEKVIGVSFDGTGYGDDGTLWGGEFLVADLDGFKRAGHLDYIPLPGGESAIREPWKTAVSYVRGAAGAEAMDYLRPTGLVEQFGSDTVDNVIRLCGQREFSPLSSGAGRLFDAVSALIGVCRKNTFEGEAAIALESLVLDELDDDYPVDVSFREMMGIDFSMTILGLVRDMRSGVSPAVMATKFHNTVASAVVTVVQKLSVVHNIRTAVLSGGVFQNACLTRMVMDGLLAGGMKVCVNEVVPCNDAGVSLGQAYIMRERLKARKKAGT